jgi:hypothetical protein
VPWKRNVLTIDVAKRTCALDEVFGYEMATSTHLLLYKVVGSCFGYQELARKVDARLIFRQKGVNDTVERDLDRPCR